MTAMRSCLLVLTTVLGLFTCVPSAARAATFDHIVDGSNFRMFIPDGLPRVRGLLLNFNGDNGDHRPWVDKPSFQAGVKLWGFGMIATENFGPNRKTGRRDMLLKALADLAAISKHPELVNAPLLVTGYSRGAFATTDIVESLPERVIAFVAMRGSVSSARAGETELGTLYEAARGVPGVFIASSLDTSVPPQEVYADFVAWRTREHGTLAFVVEWGANHLRPTCRLSRPLTHSSATSGPARGCRARRWQADTRGWAPDVACDSPARLQPRGA